jgi:hypothetical protein
MTESKSSVTSRWDAQRAKLKTKFPRLTDADLDFDETRKGEMLSKLQIKTGRTANELRVIIETL